MSPSESKMPLRTCSFVLFAVFALSVRYSLAQERIMLGLTTRNGSTSLPFVIAEEKGFLRSAGVNLRAKSPGKVEDLLTHQFLVSG
jgi:hypothetical protein